MPPDIRRRTHGLLLSLLFVLSPGCSSPPDDTAAVRIGVIAPLSGPLSESLGRPARQGALLAAERANHQGGLLIAGRPTRIVLQFEDSQGRPDPAVQAARKLINQTEVAAIVGPILSRTAIATASVAEQQRVPLISPTATTAELTVGRHYVFRATFLDDQQGRALARFARADLDAQTAAVLYDIAGAHNRGVAEIFRQTFEQLGGRTVAFEAFVTGEQDYRSQLSRIGAAQPDVLLLPNHPDEVPLQVSQARQLGIEATFLGSDAWDGDLYPDQAEFEGSYFTDDWLLGTTGLTSAAADAFTHAYRQAFDHPPRSVSGVVYDALGLVFRAIENAGSVDSQLIRDQLASLTDYRGVSGKVSFQGTGDPLKAVFIFRIAGGKVAFAKEISP
ncbi:MAG: ABC transporter substrate-binding protein [Acidobacteriota bacterium]